MYEEEVQAITKEFLERKSNKVTEHPDGKSGVDILAIDENNNKIFVEIKGSKTKRAKKKDKNGNIIEEFTQNQNKHHFAYGIYQLMTRIQNDTERGMLFLPHHKDFEKLIKNTEQIIKKTGFQIYFVYSYNKIKRII